MSSDGTSEVSTPPASRGETHEAREKGMSEERRALLSQEWCSKSIILPSGITVGEVVATLAAKDAEMARLKEENRSLGEMFDAVVKECSNANDEVLRLREELARYRTATPVEVERLRGLLALPSIAGEWYGNRGEVYQRRPGQGASFVCTMALPREQDGPLPSYDDAIKARDERVWFVVEAANRLPALLDSYSAMAAKVEAAEWKLSQCSQELQDDLDAALAARNAAEARKEQA